MEDKTIKREPLFQEFSEADYDQWKDAAIALLKGRPFEKVLYTPTPEGITLEPIYFEKVLSDLPYADTLPGEAPYLRGTDCTGNLVQPWFITQMLYAPEPEEFNTIAKRALTRGQTGLGVQLDQATLKGYDSDDALEDSLLQGLPLSTGLDVKTAFRGIDLTQTPLYINLGQQPLAVAALLLGNLEVSLSELRGVLGYDPIGNMGKSGCGKKMESAWQELYELTRLAIKRDSKVRTILVEGHPWHNGGADSASELAYVLATLAESFSHLLEKGLSIKEITSHTAISLSLGSNFFMEIAKIRAARMLYANLVEAFGGDQEDQKAWLHAKTSSWTKSVYDPWVNLLRNGSEAFSGAIGGVDSLEVVPHDETLGEADAFSRRVARNIQIILQKECHFTHPIDPAGGSWYIEWLTQQLAEKAWKRFQDIEASGGMVSMLTEGAIQAEIRHCYENRFKDMAKRKRVWVGVNMYPNLLEKSEKRHVTHDDLRQKRMVQLKTYKDEQKLSWEKAMPLEEMIGAAEKGITLSQLADHEACIEIDAVIVERGPQRFEVLRENSEKLAEKGQLPQIFHLNLGKLAEYKARADFAKGFFQVGGFELIDQGGFEDLQDAAKAAKASGAKYGVICSTDDKYLELVPDLLKAMQEETPEMELFLAGRIPAEEKEAWAKLGLKKAIYLGADAYAILSAMQQEVK